MRTTPHNWVHTRNETACRPPEQLIRGRGRLFICGDGTRHCGVSKRRHDMAMRTAIVRAPLGSAMCRLRTRS